MKRRSRLSISAKLPIGMAVLMILFLSGMAVAAYWEVRASALALATDQLDHVDRQIADLINPSSPKSMAALKTEAAATDVVAALGPDGDAAQAQVRERWKRARASGALELWNAARERVLSTEPALPPIDAKVAAELAAEADASGAVIGPLNVLDTKAFQLQIAAISNDGSVIGYLVDRRPLSSSAQFMALVTSLIGPDARLLLGNVSGDVWTDFRTPVKGPPLSAIGTTGLMSYERQDGRRVFARRLALAPAPWLVAAEIPQAQVLAPVDRFVRRAVSLEFGLSILGALNAWRFRAHITKPLRRMTDVAVSVAEAHSSRPALEDNDELNRLAYAFDQMVGALRVSEEALRASHARLERRVEERTAEVTEANRELEAFSYSVSHDLRAPLRAMRGFAEILVEDHAAELTPAARDCVNRISNNAKSMGQLIDDLLDFSKLSRQPIKRTSTDLAALARQVMRESQAAEPDRSIEFVVGDLPAVDAEPTLMPLVLDNLIRNAVKFTRPRDAARIEVGYAGRTAKDATYFVRDNGVGFDMRYADKLFHVFQRLHRKDEFEGTGVGLAIVHRIVSRHGGRVWAESVAGEGATFFFTLPASAGGAGD
jgi:signal transduction histidine kinase